MHDFFYDLRNFPSYFKEEELHIAPRNKKIKVSDEHEENEVLPKIEYKEPNLSQEIICALTDEIFTINDRQKRYATVINILKSDLIKWKRPIVQLPNLCLTPIDKTRFRFDYKDCLITMVSRSYLVDEYLEFIQNKNLLYLYGLKGIGKSYIIYQMVAKLMIMDEKYRVIYINSTDSSVIMYVRSTLKAIILFDCQKEEFREKFNKFMTDSKSTEMNDFINLNTINNNFDVACTIISSLSLFYNEQKIRLLFVFDQTNLLLGRPKNEIELKFLAWIMKNFKTIISGSANNEIEALKVPEDSLRFPPIQFTLEEFKVFRNFYASGLKFVTTVEKAKQVLSVTGGVALEIHRFMRSKDANSFDEMIIDYNNDFLNAIIPDRFESWFNKLNDEYKKFAIENVVRCLFKSNLDPDHYNFYDKRLFYLKITNKRYYLNPFSCMAMNAILNFYNQYLQVHLVNEFQTLMRSSSGYTRSTLGDCVQVFITQSLCLGMLSNSDYKMDFEVDIYGKSITDVITMKNFEVIRFVGLRVPPTLSFDHNDKNKLYVPLAHNYPGFDLFYYDSVKKTFYCIQITIDKNPMEHVIKNDCQVFNYKVSEAVEFRPNSDLSKVINEWINYLPSGTVFIEIWMLNKKYLESHNYCERRSQRLKHMNIAYFHKMTGMETLANFFQTKQ